MGVGPDLGLAGPDVAVREALLPQLHDQPADGALLLPRDQVGGQVEGRRGDQRVEDLAADRLLLLRSRCRRSRASRTASRSSSRLSKPIELEERGVDLGQPQLLQVVDLTFTLTVWPRRAGSADGGAELRLDLPRLARLDSLERRADRRDVPVLEPQLGLEPELDLLDLVEDARRRADERQVGRQVVADPRRPFELGDDLGVPLQEPRELGLDVRLADRLAPAA